MELGFGGLNFLNCQEHQLAPSDFAEIGLKRFLILDFGATTQHFCDFRFNTQAFPESGKHFFASKMSNSDFPHVFTPRWVNSRENFLKFFHMGGPPPIV
jgi:hypothetical protein